MTLHPQAIKPVPVETARVAQAAFPKGNLYMTMRDELGSLYEDEDFIDLYVQDGQPALAPWRLALVCVMQYISGLSDRQAAEAVRSRLDWKYALSLDLSDPGFDFTVLSEFRQRLIQGGAERLLLNKLLAKCQEKGWLKQRGQQRTLLFTGSLKTSVKVKETGRRGDCASCPVRCRCVRSVQAARKLTLRVKEEYLALQKAAENSRELNPSGLIDT